MAISLKKYSFDIPSERDVIIAHCCDNNRVAQEMIYRHYFPVMERMVMKYTQDDDQIIDILNDGFLRVFKKISLYEGLGSFEGWIRKIIYHSVSNYFRKYSKDLKFLIYEEEFKSEPTTPAQHDLYFNDLISLVEALPDKYSKVFHLFAIQGFNHDEISNQLNLNKNTCRWYLSEARKILQKEYSKKYLSSSYNEAG